MKNALLKHHIKNILRFSLNTVSPLFSRKSGISPDAARERLQQACPVPAGTVQGENALLPPSVDLQIVIPAYNVEAYLEECMESVLSQKTEYSYHIVLVDDGSRDNTPAICDQYAEHPRVTVIHQPNRGLSGARNAGLREIRGRYLMFLDSDDILLEGALQALLDTAFRNGADLVEGGVCYLHPGSRELMYRHSDTSRAADPYAQLHGIACGKLYRAELFESLCFPEGFLFEDSIISFLIFPKLTNAWVCPHVCYGYRINQSGIVRSSHGDPRSVQTYWITEMLMAQYGQEGYPVTDSYLRFVLNQFRLNQHRVSGLEEAIAESVFILSCQLLDRWFPEDWQDRKYRALLDAMRSRDFGAFRMCCRQL